MIVEGLTALTVGKVIHDMRQSDQLNEQAKKKMVKSFSRIADAQIAQKEEEEVMQNAVLRLTNRKRAILATSMKDFLHVYEKLLKINFVESDGIKELEEFTPAIAEDLHMQISTIQGMPQMPVVTKNVVVGWLIGGFFGAVSSSIVDDSKKNLDMSRMQSRQADVIAQQAQGITLVYQAVTERASSMADVLTKLNMLFIKGIRYTDALMERKGVEKRNYTLEDRKALAACINLAGAVKGILDVPIIDTKGEITQKSLETIQLGEHYLQEINFAMAER